MAVQYIAVFEHNTHDTDVHGLTFISTTRQLLVHEVHATVSDLDAVVLIKLYRLGGTKANLVGLEPGFRRTGSSLHGKYDITSPSDERIVGSYYVTSSCSLMLKFPQPVELLPSGAGNSPIFGYRTIRSNDGSDVPVAVNIYFEEF